MSNKFTVEIITPDRSILQSNAIEVIIPSYEGQMGILKDHIPLITFLRPGLISIKNENEKKYYIEEGTVEFSNNNLLILTSNVKDLENLNKDSVDNMIAYAKKELDNDNSTDKEKYIVSYKLETLKEINR